MDRATVRCLHPRRRSPGGQQAHHDPVHVPASAQVYAPVPVTQVIRPGSEGTEQTPGAVFAHVDPAGPGPGSDRVGETFFSVWREDEHAVTADMNIDSDIPVVGKGNVLLIGAGRAEGEQGSYQGALRMLCLDQRCDHRGRAEVRSEGRLPPALPTVPHTGSGEQFPGKMRTVLPHRRTAPAAPAVHLRIRLPGMHSITRLRSAGMPAQPRNHYDRGRTHQRGQYPGWPQTTGNHGIVTLSRAEQWRNRPRQPGRSWTSLHSAWLSVRCGA